MIPLPATFIVRWRWPIVAAWVLLTALVLPAAREVHERLQVGGQKLHEFESARADRIMRERINTPFTAFVAVVVKNDSLRIGDARFDAYVDSLTLALERLPFVLRTVSPRQGGMAQPLQSADGHVVLILAGLRKATDADPPNYVPRIRDALREAGAGLGVGFQASVTGSPAFDYDTRIITADDSARIEKLVLPIALVLLIIAFGTLAGAAMPILVGFFAIEISLGIVSLLATYVSMSIFVLNITTMVGLGVGIDYSLLIVTRYREELAAGLDPHEAAVLTIRTAASAVITSGATVMVGLIGLMVVPLTETRSVGFGGMLVVGVAILLSISFLPAALAIVGRRVEWPPGLARRLAPLRSEIAWTRYAASISRHPLRAVIVSSAIMGVLTLPAAWLKIGLPVSGWFPRDTEAGRGVKVLEAMGQAGSLLPVRVVLQTANGTPVLDVERLRGLAQLSDAIRADPRVRDVRGLVDLRPGIPLWQYAQLYADTARARARAADAFRLFLSRDGTATVFEVLLRDSVSLNGSLAVVRRVRAIHPDSLATLAGAQLLVTGFAAASVDFRDELVRRFPALVLVVLGVTALMLGLVFRSILVPVKAVIMNCFSVTAAFGMTVLVFQWGVGGRLVGLDGPTEAIFVLGPVLVFAIVFGLSMDYEVFLLSRIKEEFDGSKDNESATIAGLAATGATITNAALIMILVFGAFSFARVLAVQMVGFGLAVAVLLDATVIRMVMVPAVMHLAGRFNWWPGYRRRGLPGHYRRGSSTAKDPSAT